MLAKPGNETPSMHSSILKRIYKKSGYNAEKNFNEPEKKSIFEHLDKIRSEAREEEIYYILDAALTFIHTQGDSDKRAVYTSETAKKSRADNQQKLREHYTELGMAEGEFTLLLYTAELEKRAQELVGLAYPQLRKQERE